MDSEKDKPFVLFNCSTNVIGGGIKNSVVFIRHALDSEKFLWHFAISPQVAETLEAYHLTLDHRFRIIDPSPARSRNSRIELIKLIDKTPFIGVYTMAGPAYIETNLTHVQGISHAFITHPRLEAFFLRPGIYHTFRRLLETIIKAHYSLKADFFIFQTESARSGFCKRYHISFNRTRVIPNAFDRELFEMPKECKNVADSSRKKIIIFCPAAAYFHKGLHFIPDIASELVKIANGLVFEFILSLDETSVLWNVVKKRNKRLNTERFVHTIGSYNYRDSASLYQNSTLVFVPSLLETYSATYLEAMVARRPLIVAERPFAREICRDAALYVEPKNSRETAMKILGLINNKELQKRFVMNGLQVLASSIDQDQRFILIENELSKLFNTTASS